MYSYILVSLKIFFIQIQYYTKIEHVICSKLRQFYIYIYVRKIIYTHWNSEKYLSEWFKGNVHGSYVHTYDTLCFPSKKKKKLAHKTSGGGVGHGNTNYIIYTRKTIFIRTTLVDWNMCCSMVTSNDSYSVNLNIVLGLFITKVFRNASPRRHSGHYQPFWWRQWLQRSDYSPPSPLSPLANDGNDAIITINRSTAPCPRTSGTGHCRRHFHWITQLL